MKRKYGPIQVDDECVDQMVNAGNLRTAETWGDITDMPITAEELQRCKDGRVTKHRGMMAQVWISSRKTGAY